MRRFWWYFFLTFDVLLLGVYLAGYLAKWIDPRTVWWPQLIAVGLPFFSILVVISTLIAAFARKGRLVAVHLILVLLIAVRFFSFPRSHAALPEEAALLRIVSYNLGHFEDLPELEQAQKLDEVLGQLNPDIIGLQEFLVRYRGEQLRIRNLPYLAGKLDSLGFQSVASENHEVASTFQPIFSRAGKLDQIEQRRLPVHEIGYPDLGVMRLRFRWQEREAVYYNLHLRTFGEKKPWMETSMSPFSFEFWFFYLRQYRDAFLFRAWQADKVRALIDKEEVPVIVGGDFNSTQHNWVFQHLARGMQDVFAEAGKKRKASYHAKFPLARIDHLLVSKQWKVYRADVPAFEYSDHRPIMAILGFESDP